MTPKVKIRVKSKSKKEEYEDAMQAQWKSRPENQPKTEAMSKRTKVVEDMPKKKK